MKRAGEYIDEMRELAANMERLAQEMARDAALGFAPEDGRLSELRRMGEQQAGLRGELCALLQKSNLPLYGTALRNDTVSLRDAELSRAAVAIGSEGRGLSAEILSKCEKTIKIPMSPRCESLNAAVAASVVLWEMYR